ncbi:MAG: preprotein translocase subunit SecA, partial [Actinobacteria bacterium]|nr:preprotein translocase subunit SecA [Actinomycetota bacterium]
DVDYADVDGEVCIIDEFTGRILDGRRWSEGLHQAVEAKEGVRVQEENQTLATITLQNFFRLYDKLSGMTGTALTEATEFMKIYKLGVVQVPTNRGMVRVDQNDQIYKTKDGKWSAVAREIAARHEQGQPVLVGTISVEISELLGSMLAERGIPHTVLNAKPEYAEREGEIIAEAGRPGAVTIATNMAGRGVDIKLGGSPEHLAREELTASGISPEDPDFAAKLPAVVSEQEIKVAAARDAVMEAGGLFIVGTERHESRRIDNQLRGRAGRQGDPGETRFFLSAEDDLVRLFAGDRIYKILDRLGGTDEEGNEEPIEAGMLSKQIEKAQRKVEEQNFLIRKRVLEYDDVMNEQRRVVYAYRDEVLEGVDLGDQARTEIADVARRLVDEYTPSDYIEDWDLEGLFVALADIMPIGTINAELTAAGVLAGNLDRDSLRDGVVDEAMELYDGREEELGDELMRALERYLLLQTIDQRWKEHLYDMDYLREGIHLRGFAQIDPLVAYKNEAFTLFGDLMNSIWSDFARMVYHVEVEVELEDPQAVPFAPASTPSGDVSYSSGGGPTALQAAAAGTEVAYADDEPAPQAPQVEQRVLDAEEQIGRNDPCWCGSGQKYKKCHGA